MSDKIHKSREGYWNRIPEIAAYDTEEVIADMPEPLKQELSVDMTNAYIEPKWGNSILNDVVGHCLTEQILKDASEEIIQHQWEPQGLWLDYSVFNKHQEFSMGSRKEDFHSHYLGVPYEIKIQEEEQLMEDQFMIGYGDLDSPTYTFTLADVGTSGFNQGDELRIESCKETIHLRYDENAGDWVQTPAKEVPQPRLANGKFLNWLNDARDGTEVIIHHNGGRERQRCRILKHEEDGVTVALIKDGKHSDPVKMPLLAVCEYVEDGLTETKPEYEEVRTPWDPEL